MPMAIYGAVHTMTLFVIINKLVQSPFMGHIMDYLRETLWKKLLLSLPMALYSLALLKGLAILK